MTVKKTHEASEAMIDEALIETFPASDAPAWTLGVENTESPIEPPKGQTYVTRDTLLKLLSDAEIARVATLESTSQLADGEEYLDLARPERGVLRVQSGQPLDMGHTLPRSAVSDETWAKILSEAHRGWQKPRTSQGRPSGLA